MIVTFNHCRYFLLPYAVFVEYILNLQKSNLFHCFFESAFRGVGGFFCALLHAFREISLVAYKAVVFLSQRTELVAHGFTDCVFKVAVALAVKFFFYFLICFSGAARVNSHKVVYAVFAVFSVYACFAVGDGAFDFLHNCIVVVKHGNKRLWIGI